MKSSAVYRSYRAEQTEGYTGAELERVAKEAIWTHLTEREGAEAGQTRISVESISEAFRAYQPPANRSQFQRMEEDALAEVTAIDLLPPKYREQRQDSV